MKALQTSLRILSAFCGERTSWGVTELAAALKLEKPLVSKNGFIEWLPLMLNGWTQTRDLKAMPAQSFRDWWAKEKAPQANGSEEGHSG